jgi:hypothetical protein
VTGFTLRVPIREFFHLIHIVDHEDEVDAWYDEVFAPERFMKKGWIDSEKRWASLSMVGDLMIEVIEPSSDPRDQHMPLSKFRNRFGQHFHSLAWYVDPLDVKPLFDRLRTGGIRVAKPGGGMFPDGDVDPGNTIFTHPRDTFGQLEFEGLADHWLRMDPRFQPGWSSDRWLDQPLGIVRASHLTVVVDDLDRACRLYQSAFDGVMLHRQSSSVGEAVHVAVGTDTVVELVSPATSDSRAGRDRQVNGSVPHACTFTVQDLDRAERHVERVGVGVVDRSGDSFTLDPADSYGAVYAFTDRTVPGDPRVGGAGS